MSRETVKGILRGYEALNRGDLETATEGIAPDCEMELPPILPDVQATSKGPEGLRRMWEGWRETFDDFRMEVEEVIDADDRVVVMACACGVGKDSGVEVRTPTFPLIWTVKDGQVVRVKALPTRAAALEEVGREE
jgi:ketosteroid isomerase-like protein